MQYWWLAALNTSRTVLTTKDNKKDDSYPAADCYCRFQLRVVCKKAQMETSQTAHGHPKTVIDNRHEHTIIATLAVKKGSKFTDPDAQFPRGGALACARGLAFSNIR